MSVCMSSKRTISGRTIEIPQCTRISKVNCCLKVHSAYLKLAPPISDKIDAIVLLVILKLSLFSLRLKAFANDPVIELLNQF